MKETQVDFVPMGVLMRARHDAMQATELAYYKKVAEDLTHQLEMMVDALVRGEPAAIYSHKGIVRIIREPEAK